MKIGSKKISGSLNSAFNFIADGLSCWGARMGGLVAILLFILYCYSPCTPLRYYPELKKCININGTIKRVNIGNLTIFICCNETSKTWTGIYWGVKNLSKKLEQKLYKIANETCKKI